MYTEVDGYCYASLTEACEAAIYKKGNMITQTTSSNAVIIAPHSCTEDGNTATEIYIQKPIVTGTQQILTITNMTYGECSSVGPINNQSGISLSDSITTSWLVVLVWIAAYSFKAWRQGARGY